MRNRLQLALTCGLVVVAAWGALAPGALADPLEDCNTQPPRPKGINGFHVVTVPDTAGSIADVYAGFAACGMEPTPSGEHGKRFYILTAGGMDSGEGGPKVRCANPRYASNGHNAYCEGTDLGAPYNPNSPMGPYVGTTHADLQRCGVLVCNEQTSQVETNVNAAPGLFGQGVVENPNCNKSTVVQCFSAAVDESLGVSHITVEPCWVLHWCRGAKAPAIPDLDPQHNRYVVTQYEITNELPQFGDLWYHEIGEVDYVGHEQGEPNDEDLHLCARANPDPAARTCGADDADWVHKNGPAGEYGCTRTRPEGYSMRLLTTKGNNYEACDPLTWS